MVGTRNAREELEWMNRLTGIASFPSANSHAATTKEQAEKKQQQQADAESDSRDT